LLQAYLPFIAFNSPQSEWGFFPLSIALSYLSPIS
jgi:hypothetical protein